MPISRRWEKLKPSSMSINHSNLFLVERQFKIFTNSGNFWLIYLFETFINWLIYLPARLRMHDLKRIFISSSENFPKFASNFKHNIVIL